MNILFICAELYVSFSRDSPKFTLTLERDDSEERERKCSDVTKINLETLPK